MCGIAGKVRISEGGGLDPACMGTMLGMLRHRGPDESGLYIDDHAMLGQTRLSIIGIQGGVQPIHNEDETLWIVFNGEIFNYLELKEALVRNGHRFYTNTDTEVILHLFEEHGPSCLSRLNGQFACALWDSRRKSLFLARDRLGIRPLHYTVRDGALIFASEIKAIFADRTIPRELDLEALHHVFSYWSVLPGETPFRDVRELEPGHFMVLADGRLTVQKYWDIPFPADGEGFERPLTEVAEELRELLLDAIRIRLRSDVPVGCYVSGGLDSTAIVCLLVRNFSAGVRTFGIRFEDALFDEGRFQEIVVSEIGTRHTAVEATDEKIGQAIPDVLWHCERPLLRTAPVPLYLLSRSVREHGFKVVLTGEGADEVFGGYNIFREAKARQFIAKQPHSAFRRQIVRKLYPYIFTDARQRALLPPFFSRGLDRLTDPFSSHHIRWQNTERSKMFFSEDLLRAGNAERDARQLIRILPPEFERWDPVARAQYLEMRIFLSNYLLSSQGDRVAMANSVEIRMPYLDYRLVEFMGRVPSRLKISGLQEKYLLKKAVRGDVPEAIWKRPKHPYRAPVSGSLFHPGASPMIREQLAPEALKRAGLFDEKKVAKLCGKLAQGGGSEVENMAIAGIASTQIIRGQFIDRFPYRQSTPPQLNLMVDRRIRPKRAEAKQHRLIA